MISRILRINSKRSILLVLIISLLLYALMICYVYRVSQTPVVYSRLSLPDELTEFASREYNGIDTFESYILEFMHIMLPEYENKPSDTTFSYNVKDVCGDNEMCIGFETTEFRGNRDSVSLRMNNGIEALTFFNHLFRSPPHTNGGATTLFNYETGAFVKVAETTYEVCGVLADGRTCITYKNEIGNTCYLEAINGQFKMFQDDRSYCPDDSVFSTKNEQLAAYVFDGYMSLNIPYELSLEYQESK